MTHTQPVIRTAGLTKTFTRHKQTVEAVRGLDLEVQEGELVAFLGPNGAGKSTTLRMLTTLIEPTSGTAEVAGYDVVREPSRRTPLDRVRRPGQRRGHKQRGRDEVVSQGRAHGLSRAAANARADELLEAFDLTEHARRPVSTLSGGQRRRLDVAIGLVHSPRLLFLDEPSTGSGPAEPGQPPGADAAAQPRAGHHDRADHSLPRRGRRDRGPGAGHRPRPADRRRQRIPAEVGARRPGVAGLRQPSDAFVAAARAEQIDGASVTVDGNDVSIRVAHGRDLAPELVTDLAWAGTPAVRIEVVGPTLDDVFLDLTGRSLRESN